MSMKIKLLSNSGVRRCVSILGTCVSLINPMYAMNTFHNNSSTYSYRIKFFNFVNNSAFNTFSRVDLMENNISNCSFEEDKLNINMLQKSYNMLRYYCDVEGALDNMLFVSEDVVSDLIKYISNYEYDGTFLSICEIFQLTLECLIRVNREDLTGFNNMDFHFENFKENKTTITFTKFKECMISRLEKLLENMK